MELDLNLGLGAEHSGKPTPKLQITSNAPTLLTLQSGVDKPLTFTVTAGQDLTIDTWNLPTGISMTAPTGGTTLTAGQTVDFVGTINSSVLGQHYVAIGVVGTQGGVTLGKNIPIHYVVAGATDTFIVNSGNTIVNNHKSIINT